MNGNEVRSRASDLCKRLKASSVDREWKEIAKELSGVLTDYWDVHPHSAMEMLEYATHLLSLPLAHALVRQVVQGWRTKSTYDPTAGGAADHCYLSALILSESYDLAEHPWADGLLPRTLEKELSPGRFADMRDGAKKEALVRGLAASTGWRPRAR